MKPILLTSRGETRTMPQWARSLGIHPESVRMRLKSGWSVDDAVRRPAGWRPLPVPIAKMSPEQLREYESSRRRTNARGRLSTLRVTAKKNGHAPPKVSGAVEFAQWIASQPKACAICGDDKARLVVDHCHRTGKLRGLLCAFCNMIVGVHETHPERVDACKAYAESHQ